MTPDPGKLVATGITVTDILNAIQLTNLVDSPGLYADSARTGARSHRCPGARRGSTRVRSSSRTSPAGVPVRIADVATVSQSIEPAYTMVRADGKPAVLLNITRQPSSNTVQVADEVAAEVEQLKRLLPPGVTLKPYYDQSELVRDSIRSVRDAILIGLILATIIIIVFLRDWRSSLVAGLVIPTTISITFVFLYLLGESFNLMTLGGLAAAVGLVIDDAIVVVENIVLHRQSGEGRVDAIRKALNEITDAAGRFDDYSHRRFPSAHLGLRRHRQLLPRAGHHHDGRRCWRRCCSPSRGRRPSAALLLRDGQRR